MLARSKEQDLTDAFRGPIGAFGLGIVVIAAALAVADTFVPDADELPDERPLFGNFFTSAIDEGVYYLKWVSYVSIAVGGIMVGVSLRLCPAAGRGRPGARPGGGPAPPSGRCRDGSGTARPEETRPSGSSRRR